MMKCNLTRFTTKQRKKYYILIERTWWTNIKVVSDLKDVADALVTRKVSLVYS